MEKYDRSVLGVCQQLHEAKTGSGDPLTDNAAILLRAWLVTRQMDWDKSHGDSAGYDNAVFALITAALKEYS